MPATEPKCLFIGDKFERCVRQCIVFPADGLATRIEHMIVETVTTTQDISALRLHSRCVDLTSTFGAEHRDLKTRVVVLSITHAGDTHAYLFYYNRSLRLPINLNVAELVGVSSSHLKTKKHVFWRGDIVVMKVKPESETIDFIVKPLDADLSELGTLEEFLRTKHREGYLAQELHGDEMQCEQTTTHDIARYAVHHRSSLNRLELQGSRMLKLSARLVTRLVDQKHIGAKTQRRRKVRSALLHLPHSPHLISNYSENFLSDINEQLSAIG